MSGFGEAERLDRGDVVVPVCGDSVLVLELEMELMSVDSSLSDSEEVEDEENEEKDEEALVLVTERRCPVGASGLLAHRTFPREELVEHFLPCA